MEVNCRAISSPVPRPPLESPRARPEPVDTENLVRSENTEVPIIREIMVATTMSSLFVALFALLACPKMYDFFAPKPLSTSVSFREI
jgi:hypothetical protein